MVAAIVVVWFFWGATPAGMRLAMNAMPAYVMATLRFCIAGGIIAGIALAAGSGLPTRAMWRNALVSAVLLMLLGNGLMTWSLQYLPTGMNGILVSLAPIWLALLEFASARIVPTRLAVLGMALGVSGMLLLFAPSSLATLPFVPALVAVLSSVFWGAGSAYQRHARTGSALLATGLQMLLGSGLFAIEAWLLGDWARFDPRAVPPSALFGLAWIIFAGSLLSYPAFIYTMRHAGAALATTYAYVNPMVTVGLGMLLFGERFTPVEGLAAAVILTGVALMVVPARVKP